MVNYPKNDHNPPSYIVVNSGIEDYRMAAASG